MNASDMLRGREYIIKGTWAKCSDCWKIVRTDSWHGGVHIEVGDREMITMLGCIIMTEDCHQIAEQLYAQMMGWA